MRRVKRNAAKQLLSIMLLLCMVTGVLQPLSLYAEDGSYVNMEVEASGVEVMAVETDEAAGAIETEAFVSEPESTSVADDTGSVSAEDTAESEDLIEEETIEVFAAQEEAGDKIACLYIDQPTLVIPSEQTVAVVFEDTSLAISEATLLYRDANGADYEVDSELIADGAVKFTWGYNEAPLEMDYVLDGVRYIVDGEERTIFFEDEGMTGSFSVTSGFAGEEDGSLISVYTMNDAGDVVETSGDSIEEIEEVIAETMADNELVQEKLDEQEVISAMGDDVITTQASGGKFVIAIDPGHCNKHTGANENGVKEEELTLTLGMNLKAELEKYQNVSVVMTRTTAACPYPEYRYSADDIAKRVEAVVKKGADVYVSLHFNSTDGASAHGAEVIVQDKSYDASVAAVSDTLGHKIMDQLVAIGLYRRGRGSDGQGAYSSSTGMTSEGITDTFAVHSNTKRYHIPGIIVEHCFLSNVNDVKNYCSAEGLKKLAQADAKGIAATFNLKKKPTIALDVSELALSIEGANDAKGTWNVRIKGVPSDAEKVQIKAWSASDQSDAYTYTAKLQSNGSYLASVNVANHKNNYGTYTMQCCLIDANKDEHDTKEIQKTLSVPKATATSSLNATQKTATLKATNVALYGGVKRVSFAVWSKDGGQDDLKWYTATKSGSTYTATATISNHKHAGTYHVHTYALGNNGINNFVGSTTFTVSAPKVTSISVDSTSVNRDKGTMTINLSGVTAPSGVSKVQVPIWSMSNQKDIYWYTATKVGDGKYRVSFDNRNHMSSYGKFTIHAYVTDGNGIRSYAGSSTYTLTSSGTKTVATKSKDETTVEILATGVQLDGGVKKVQFAVWSDDKGQDDLKWYTGEVYSSSAYTYDVPISNHKTAGKYYVHVYATNSANKLVKTGETTFTITKPSNVKIAVKTNKSTGDFTATISNIKSTSGVEKIQVPVWCSNDQSDIRWYTAAKQSNGTYVASGNFANHRFHTGTYKFHVYMTTGNGIFANVGSTTTNLQYTGSKAVATLNSTETSIGMTAFGFADDTTVSRVQFAVWSKNKGQDDLRWYTATKNFEGRWSANAPVQNHKDSGQYNIHAYYRDRSGKMTFIGESKVTVSAATAKSMTVANQNASIGSFVVTLSGVTAPSGVTKVQIPVWGASNQSDIRWYTASKTGDGTYQVTVNAKNHDSSNGKYHIHAYVTAANGVRSFVASKTQTLSQLAATDTLGAANGSTSSSATSTAGLYAIMGTSNVTVARMVKHFNTYGKTYPAAELKKGGCATITAFCQTIYDEARAEGVKPEVVYAQVMLETGYLRFGGDVKISQYNFAGIGATGGGVSGNSFATVAIGLRAQVQHLKAYASTAALNKTKVDPRFNYVTRGCAPYVEWLGIPDNPKGYGWAASRNYGKNLLAIINQL